MRATEPATVTIAPRSASAIGVTISAPAGPGMANPDKAKVNKALARTTCPLIVSLTFLDAK